VGAILEGGRWCVGGAGVSWGFRFLPEDKYESPVEQHFKRMGRLLWLVPWRRGRVLREARDHLLEAVEHGMVAGLTRAESERLAVQRFGSSRRVAGQEFRQAGPIWAAIVVLVLGATAWATISTGNRAAQQVINALRTQRAPQVFRGQPNRTGNPNIPGNWAPSWAFRPRAISMSSSRDGWIVGYPATRMWRWDGSTWRTVRAPASTWRMGLDDAVALSPHDAWAVGGTTCFTASTSPDCFARLAAQIDHWNGRRWSIVPQPIHRAAFLNVVSASQPDDVWAAGDRVTVRSGQPVYKAVIERWNGRTWQILPRPWTQPGLIPTTLTANSPTDVWLLGDSLIGSGPQTAVIAHWNGTHWTQLPAPFTRAAHELAAYSPSDAWAFRIDGLYAAGSRTRAAHWNGRRWADRVTPVSGASHRGLVQTLTDAAGETRLLGWNADRQVLLSWNGHHWRDRTIARINDDGESGGTVTSDGTVFTYQNCGWLGDGHAVAPMYLLAHNDGHTWDWTVAPTPTPVPARAAKAYANPSTRRECAKVGEALYEPHLAAPTSPIRQVTSRPHVAPSPPPRKPTASDRRADIAEDELVLDQALVLAERASYDSSHHLVFTYHGLNWGEVPETYETQKSPSYTATMNGLRLLHLGRFNAALSQLRRAAVAIRRYVAAHPVETPMAPPTWVVGNFLASAPRANRAIIRAELQSPADDSAVRRRAAKAKDGLVQHGIVTLNKGKGLPSFTPTWLAHGSIWREIYARYTDIARHPRDVARVRSDIEAIEALLPPRGRALSN
jgi:hypothetical protein